MSTNEDRPLPSPGVIKAWFRNNMREAESASNQPEDCLLRQLAREVVDEERRKLVEKMKRDKIRSEWAAHTLARGPKRQKRLRNQ
jgi:hypothetical protein